MANKTKNYYNLSIYSAGSPDEWGNRISLSFAGATYAEVVALAKERNVDICDRKKWDVNLYYRVPKTYEIIASCTLRADSEGVLYWSYASSQWKYTGKDPIPRAKKARQK